jgi:hypothetical protein
MSPHVTRRANDMTAEERAKKSVEAAIKRFEDGRVVVYVEPSDDATTSILSAGAAVKKNFKPTADDLLDVTNRRVGLEDAPGDFDCFGMEAVMWHLQEMARQAFNEELRNRGVEKPVREQWLRKLTLVKEKN